MTTQYYVAASLDGFIADTDNSIEWLLQFGFEEFTPHYEKFLSGVGALVMGASTYEFLLAEGSPWGYGETPTWVLTHRELPAMEGGDIRFMAGDVAQVHAQAVAAAGEKAVWLIGGGEVVAQFAEAGLVDELWVTIMPIVLGGGTPVLPVTGSPLNLELIETTRFEPSGATELRYRVKR